MIILNTFCIGSTGPQRNTSTSNFSTTTTSTFLAFCSTLEHMSFWFLAACIMLKQTTFIFLAIGKKLEGMTFMFCGICSTLERKPSYSLLFAALWKGVFHISRYLQHFLSTRIKIHDICMEISKIEMFWVLGRAVLLLNKSLSLCFTGKYQR